MTESDKAYWDGVQSWLKESQLCVEGNELEAQYLLKQNDLNNQRVALLRENNAHLSEVIRLKQQQYDEAMAKSES